MGWNLNLVLQVLSLRRHFGAQWDIARIIFATAYRVAFLAKHFLLYVAAITEVNGMLGKNMAKFCSGDYNPEVVPAETRHLDPLLSTASKSPPTQIPAKGLDGCVISSLYFLVGCP